MKTFPLFDAERAGMLSFVKAIEFENLKPETSAGSQWGQAYSRFTLIDLLVIISFCYLLFPIMIFIIGFVRVEISVAFAVLTCCGLYRLIRKAAFAISTKIYIQNVKSEWRTWRGHLVLMSLLALTWLSFSSIGGIGYRNFDSGIRSSLLWHLVTGEWPLYFKAGYFREGFGVNTEKAYVYYFAYYLPAAVAGKLLGWKAANLALFGYSWVGVSLALMLARMYVRRHGYAVTLMVFTGICLFGGMDYVCNWLLKLTADRSEMWLSPLHYFSHTRNLFWAPQHCLPTWLIIGIILSHKQISPLLMRIFPLACVSMLLWSPLCLIGTAPFLLLMLKHHWREWLRWRLENGLACLLFVLLSAFIISNDFSFEMIYAPNVIDNFWMRYCLFLAYEFLILSSILLFLNAKTRRNGVLIITILLLIAIPFFILGRWNDWCIKLSIAPLFVLSIFIIKQIVWLVENKRKLLFIPVFLFAACALTPLEELVYSAQNYRISFERPPQIRDFGANYIVWQQLGNSQSFFFRYLARQ